MNDEQVNRVLEKLAVDMGAIHDPSLGRKTLREAMRLAFGAGFKAGYLNFDPWATGTTEESAYEHYSEDQALIASAPDLLAALEELHRDANRLCDRNLGGTYEEDCRRSIAKAKAALDSRRRISKMAKK